MLEVLGPDQRAPADGMNDTTPSQEWIEIDRADRRRTLPVVQRRIGVRAQMGRHRDRADVDRATRTDLRGPALLIGRVARERR